jgi:small GTP-binding protein
MTGDFPTDIRPTAGAELFLFNFKNGNDLKLSLWDTAGAERFRSLTKNYFRNADGAFVIFSIVDQNSFENVPNWINDIHASANIDIPIVLLGNKGDLFHQRDVKIEDINELKNQLNLNYFEVSAVTGIGIKDSLEYLCSEILERKNKLNEPIHEKYKSFPESMKQKSYCS